MDVRNPPAAVAALIEGGGVPLWLAFVAGAVSFASACVLPIVPAYGVLIAGAGGMERGGAVGGGRRGRVRLPALFLAGFALFFILSGATAAAVGGVVRGISDGVELVGAVAVALLGVALVATVARSFDAGGERWSAAVGGVAAFLAGAGFSAAWTPCIGPVLAEILLYGAFPETLAEGLLLLTVYTIGLATPFLAIGVAVGWGIEHARGLRGYRPLVGILLLLLGGLLLTGRFARLTAYLSGFGPMIEIGL